MSWTCDKENDCENGADEAHCGKLTCLNPNKLQCSAARLFYGRDYGILFCPRFVQMNSAQLLSLSAQTIAASPNAGCVTEPTTVVTTATRTANAVSETLSAKKKPHLDCNGLCGEIENGFD